MEFADREIADSRVQFLWQAGQVASVLLHAFSIANGHCSRQCGCVAFLTRRSVGLRPEEN